MADESKRYPLSARKLERLWQAGSTPASPGLVAAAVLAVTATLAALAGPTIARWMAGWVQDGLHAAAQPEAAAVYARALALRGGLLIAGIGALLLAAALVAQVSQAGSHASATPATPARREGGRLPWVDAWRIARAVLLTAMAGIVGAAAVRGVLGGIDEAFDPWKPMDTFIDLMRSMAWPLLIVLAAVAVLDAIAGRAAWTQRAWMTRREVEEEMRDTEGHPLTRERRDVVARRRRDG